MSRAVRPVGGRVLQVGVDANQSVVDMRDCTSLAEDGNWETVKQHLQTDGYVLVRGVVPRPVVLKARALMVKHLKSKVHCSFLCA